jgi:hypothetical protein
VYWSDSGRIDQSRRLKIMFGDIEVIRSVWNKEELSQQLKEYIIVPIHKKGI